MRELIGSVLKRAFGPAIEWVRQLKADDDRIRQEVIDELRLRDCDPTSFRKCRRCWAASLGYDESEGPRNPGCILVDVLAARAAVTEQRRSVQRAQAQVRIDAGLHDADLELHDHPNPALCFCNTQMRGRHANGAL